MLPLKNILCPTDFSSDARSALRMANEMALYFSAKLTLVNVVPPPMNAVWPVDGYTVGAAGGETDPKFNLEGSEKSLAEEANDHISREVDTSLRVLEGDPVDEILHVAYSTDCDLIVIATHGHSRLRSAILGSTAEMLVRKSPCPVITLHAGQEDSRLGGTLRAEEAEI